MSGLLLEQELAVLHLTKQSVQVVMYEADSLLFHCGAVVFCVTLSEAIISSSPYYDIFFLLSFLISPVSSCLLVMCICLCMVYTVLF